MNLYRYIFFQKLTKLDTIQEIWLYGSCARGDSTDISDIDLAIVAPTLSDEDWKLAQSYVRDADTLTKIDLVWYDQLDDTSLLRKNINRDKKLLFKQGSFEMEKEFWIDSLSELGNAVGRLNDLMNMPGIDTLDYLRDATIQRFEFTIELYWKVLRKILAYEGFSAVTPREVLKSAYQAGLITGDAIWLKMLDDRNKTSHVYAEEIIIEIFNRIRHDYTPVLASNYKNLDKKYVTKTP